MLTDTEMNALVGKLRDHTPLGRLNQGEAGAVLTKLAELGYTVTKAAAPTTAPAGA
jgi:hypothetical protein